ncbi:hypothetical protein NQZ79_g6158 [Umbelopsis isabellina]|nr:hypothetical protein NQZ79_g6158 [Umbelopsis isabellina]
MKVLGNWCTIFGVLSLAIASQAAPKNNQPVVVPSLKTWTSGNGHVQLTHTSRIVVDSKYKSENDQGSRMENPADLKDIASTLADDLKIISSLHLNVVVGKPRKGDIYLELGELKNQTSDEAYLMKIASSSITVTGPTSRAVYYGTRSMLQILVQSNGKDTLPAGETLDWPTYPIRGFFLDDARKYFPLDFLKDYIRFMGWFKLNTFHLHLNDNDFLSSPTDPTWKTKYAGFRLKTDNPALSGLARGEDQWYTKSEFRDFQDFAKANAMTILPEFDSPAHSLAFVQFKPEIGAFPVLDNSYLDLNKTIAFTFMETVWDEFAPWFDSKTLHIGADEYPASQAVQFRNYVNTIARHIWEKHGKRAQVWGTGIEFDPANKTSIDSNITISHWANWEDNPSNITLDGFEVINVNDGGPCSTYIVPKSGGGGDSINDVNFLAEYNPPIFGAGYNLNTPEQLSKLLGGMFAVWFELMKGDPKPDNLGNATTKWETHSLVGNTMATISQIVWNGSQNHTDPDSFFSHVDAVTQGPVNLRLEIPTKGDMILDYNLKGGNDHVLQDNSGNRYNAKLSNTKLIGHGNANALAFSGPSSRATMNLGTKGFNSTLAMQITIKNTELQTLLSSDQGQLQLSQSQISISNDNYTYTVDFNTTLSKSTNIAITSESYPIGSKLYLDGKFHGNFTYLIPRTNSSVPMGLVTPLDVLGGGFEGSLSAFQIYVGFLYLANRELIAY